MLQLKIDIIGNDFLTNTFYSGQFKNINMARKAADELRSRLFNERNDRKFRDYIVDIVPLNF